MANSLGQATYTPWDTLETTDDAEGILDIMLRDLLSDGGDAGGDRDWPAPSTGCDVLLLSTRTGGEEGGVGLAIRVLLLALRGTRAIIDPGTEALLCILRPELCASSVDVRAAMSGVCLSEDGAEHWGDAGTEGLDSTSSGGGSGCAGHRTCRASVSGRGPKEGDPSSVYVGAGRGSPSCSSMWIERVRASSMCSAGSSSSRGVTTPLPARKRIAATAMARMKALRRKRALVAAAWPTTTVRPFATAADKTPATARPLLKFAGSPSCSSATLIMSWEMADW
mmetsp:Transcript_580/g.1404  ORF Transcript_580/g.1404 Transcript_580/m.1404 type:complete len:281 (-) Transcript_580:450-1292(-)